MTRIQKTAVVAIPSVQAHQWNPVPHPDIIVPGLLVSLTHHHAARG